MSDYQHGTISGAVQQSKTVYKRSVEFERRGAFPVTGDAELLYIAVDENKPYRWDTSAEDYVFVGVDAYTKDEVYTKEQTYSKEEVYAKDETYSRKEVYSKEDTYSKGEVYTKEQTYGRDEVYAKGETYSKSETDKLIGEQINEKLPVPYNFVPSPLGVVDPGKSPDFARGDHVHQMPTPEDIGTYSMKDIDAKLEIIKQQINKPLIESFSYIQMLVRAGLHKVYFNIGDQIAVEKVTADGTVEELIWDVIGIDHDTPSDPQFTHSLTLQLHDCYASMQIGSKEALFAFPDGLAAGEYKFTVDAQTWFAGDVGKTITFTLAQEIPAGGQLVVNNAYNATMIGATISAYASGAATTAIETVTMSEGSTGTDLGTVTTAVNENINSIQRALLGSNNWTESALRQYLNSDAAAGAVWTPKTKFDRPPTWAANTAGFLNGLDPEFISVLGKVKKVTALNNVSDGGGSVESDEKVFSISRTEVYAGNEITDGEGKAYPYYSDYSDLAAAGIGEDTNRIKYRNSVARYWWLRSPYVGLANHVRNITSSGAFSNIAVVNNYGVAPACCIV